MLFTWDRYNGAAERWLRQGRRHADPMGEFLTSIDVMIGIAGAACATCVLAIVFA